MPFRSFFDSEFIDPELIDTMVDALADACTAFGFNEEDTAVSLLAKRIVDAAARGIHDRALLTAVALASAPASKH